MKVLLIFASRAKITFGMAAFGRLADQGLKYLADGQVPLYGVIQRHPKLSPSE
jgi:hypothetical protein